jgi:hypothetical protein
VTMRSWLAIVVAPTVALAVQSVMFSMVTPACSTQTRLQLHLAAAVALAIVLVLGVLAFSESSVHRKEPASHDSDATEGTAPRRFLANVGSAVAGISALVIVGMWFALWVLTPCEP